MRSQAACVSFYVLLYGFYDATTCHLSPVSLPLCDLIVFSFQVCQVYEYQMVPLI